MLAYCTKSFAVVALLLAFIAQSVAAPIPCANEHTSPKSNEHQQTMQHEMSDSGNMEHHQQTLESSCCDHECSCPASVCSSFSLVSQLSTYFSSVANFQISNQHSAALLQANVTSLFRPPRLS